MKVGLVLEGHHTEHLELFLEILQELGHAVTVFINNDVYDYLSKLRLKFKFDRRILESLQRSACDKYIVMSNTLEFYNMFARAPNVIYLAHVAREIEALKGKVPVFTMSKSLGIASVTSISRRDYGNVKVTTADNLNVVKLGWVNVNEAAYRRILDTGKINLTVFTVCITPMLLRLMNDYKNNVTVHLKKSTEFIYNHVTSTNTRFVYYCPETTELFSGSITFALNNSLILLTTDAVIDYYSIPQEYCLSINRDAFVEDMTHKKVYASQDALQAYRDKVFTENTSVVKAVLDSSLGP